MTVRHVLTIVLLTPLNLVGGCTTFCRPAPAPAVNVGVAVPTAPAVAPVPFGPPPAAAPVPPPADVPQPPPPPEASKFGPPPVAGWQETWRPVSPEAIVQLSAPEPLPPDASGSRPALYPPDTSGKSVRPPAVSGNSGTRDDSSSSSPAGIPQFAVARRGVATGLKPLLDGLDWLKANGYRTVLKVRRPGEDDAAERRQVELRGMKFVVLEVSPQTLTREKLDEFVRLVTDAKEQPLLTYDRDGALAGGLWYLYYRIAERTSDEVARVRASALGLRDDQDGSHRDMWLAIQKLVSATQ